MREIKDLIDWEKFQPILADMYHENEEEEGRPHIDEILMVKLLLLQGGYGLSDYVAERQANNRISFQHFLGYPDTIPDWSNSMEIPGTSFIMTSRILVNALIILCLLNPLCSAIEFELCSMKNK